MALILAPLPAEAAAPVSPVQYSAERAVFDDNLQQRAEYVALAAARLAAMQGMLRQLANRADIRFAAKTEALDHAALLALAYAVSQTKTTQILHEGEPPHARVHVTMISHILSPETTVRDAMGAPDTLELYKKALLREEKLIAAYDAVVQQIQRSKAPFPLTKNTRRLLMEAADTVQASQMYLTALVGLHGVWREPHTVLGAMLTARKLDPASPLIANALGEAALLSGKAHEALEAQTAAIKLDPEFARAYHARGAAYLALQLPALAVTDFSEAIRLAPRKPLFWRDRATAWLVQGETDNMCNDFYEACALGDCDGYKWATEQQKCR